MSAPVSQPSPSRCTCLPFGSSHSKPSNAQAQKDWGPYNRSATPLPRPKRSKFEDQIWKGRARFSLQICSDLHLEFYQPGLELPGIANPGSPSLRPLPTRSSALEGQGSGLRRSNTMTEEMEAASCGDSSTTDGRIYSSAPTLFHNPDELIPPPTTAQAGCSSQSDSEEEHGAKKPAASPKRTALEVPAALNRRAARALFEQFLQPGRARNLALLGDIGNPEFESYSFFLSWCAKRYERVFVVPGNHEGYGRTWDLSLALIRNACSAAGSNVHMCYRSTFEFGNVRVLATPLWSHIDEDLYAKCQRGCSDFIMITTEDQPSGEVRNVTPADTSSWHAEELAWLKQQLLARPNLPTIVLTHHAPSMACLEPDVHPTEPFAQLSCSELDAMFLDPIVCWAYGHTHFPLDCRAGTIRLVTNPAGYPRSQFPNPYGRGYRPDLIIDL